MAASRIPRLDALRAIAVLIVVLFHLDLTVFALGYLGVDLFFVLSGFLMTFTMLDDRAATGSFRVGAFFIRRGKRIVPSLILTIALCSLVAVTMMSQAHLEDFARQGFYAQIFVSNFYFYGQAGYFEPANELRPLLHTWSLSVEEQFYLFFALLLLLGKRINFTAIIVVASVTSLAIMAAAALEANGYAVFGGEYAKLPDAVFYLLPFRMVQFLVGCLIGLHVWNRRNRGASPYRPAIAVVLSAASLLLPVAGTILLNTVEAAPSLSNLLIPICFAPALLHSPLLDTLGRVSWVQLTAKISYQVYLTHWPLVVFWKYWTFNELDNFSIVILFVLSLATGWLLWRVTAALMRDGVATARRIASLGACVSLSFMIQGTAYSTEGISARIPEARRAVSPREWRKREGEYCRGSDVTATGRSLGGTPGDPLITCRREVLGGPEIYVLGDSHARHLLPGLSEAYPTANIAVMFYPSCLAQSGIGGYRYEYEGRKVRADGCVERNREAVRFIAGRPPATVVLHQYSGYIGDETETWEAAAETLLELLSAAGHRVIWIGPVPYPDRFLVDCYAVPLIFSDAQLERRCVGSPESAERISRRSAELQRRFPDQFVPVVDFFCSREDPTACRYIMDGIPTFRDKHHLTVPGSVAMVRWLRRSLQIPGH